MPAHDLEPVQTSLLDRPAAHTVLVDRVPPGHGNADMVLTGGSRNNGQTALVECR